MSWLFNYLITDRPRKSASVQNDWKESDLTQKGKRQIPFWFTVGKVPQIQKTFHDLFLNVMISEAFESFTLEIVTVKMTPSMTDVMFVLKEETQMKWASADHLQVRQCRSRNVKSDDSGSVLCKQYSNSEAGCWHGSTIWCRRQTTTTLERKALARLSVSTNANTNCKQ